MKEQFEVIAIAKVCHEANRAYCQTIGDTSQASWDGAPQWQRDSAIHGVEFHIAALSAGQKPSPAASHEKWLEDKRVDGWKFGPIKDAALKQHPCFVPYSELPVEQRLKDYIFAAIVESFFAAQYAEVLA